MAQSDSSVKKPRLKDANHIATSRMLVSSCEEENYDTHKTRVAFDRYFSRTIRNNPYDWQLDVAEAIILGLDSIVIAGTGSGKTCHL